MEQQESDAPLLLKEELRLSTINVLRTTGKKNYKRIDVPGRPLKSKEFDDALAAWVRSQREKKTQSF